MVGAAPEWEREPDIDAVASVARSILNPTGGTLTVDFFAQGGFNKVYSVECGGKCYMMRVSLPVDPFHKTLSEVTTIRYLQEKTSIPVPKIITFDASRDNAIGFEWILMERVTGKSVDKIWHTFSWEAKVELVRKVAEYIAQLSTVSFPSIGSLYPTDKALDTSREFLNEKLGLPQLPGQEPKSAAATDFAVGRICSRPFFWKDNLKLDIPRGPFKCARDWIIAELLVHEKEAQKLLEGRDVDHDEFNYDTAVKTWKMAMRMRGLIYDFFPPEQDFLEQYVLKHGDLTFRNILADDAGTITGLIDWEFVYTVPACYAGELPEFVSCATYESIFDTPREEDYMRKANGEVQSCFYQDVIQFDMKGLRAVFKEHLARLWPLWRCNSRDERTRKQADFVFATKAFAPSGLARIGKWLDAFERSLVDGSEYVPLDEF